MRSVIIHPLSFRRHPALLALLFAVLLPTAAAWAQSTESTPSAVSADEVNTVAREIWCPLCSGVRLDACELKACDQMRDVIAIKLAEGADGETIKAYFVEQYGPQVLGEPPRQGFNWLAWILPFAALALGGYFLWSRTRRMVQPTAPSSAARPPGGETGQDPYAAKLEEELTKYG